VLNKIILLIVVVYLIPYSSVSAVSESGYKEDELLVRFAPKATGTQFGTTEKNEILNTIGLGTINHEYRIVPGLSVVKLPPGKTVPDALEALNRTNGILYAEPDYKIHLLSMFPNDPNFPQLWGMHNTGQTGGTPDADIDAPEAWDIATGSEIIVAVLDTGIDYTHPDLAANMWVNTREGPGDKNGDGRPGIAGVDDDGDGLIDEDSEGRQPGESGYTNDLVNDDDENGYVDDVYGWDFADGDNNPSDYYGHGTHVAGIVGAVGSNGIGVSGVCWNVKIMNLKIFPNYGDEYFNSGAIAAIEYGVENGAQVLSNSWGGYTYRQSLKDAIEAANAAGVLFVAAAGNSGRDYAAYPARYDCNNIISVMATNANDNRATGWPYGQSSNWGATSVDLAAPGSDVLSCWLGGGYEYDYGTSMSAPFVSGACALAWSMNPALSHLWVKDIILNTVDVIPALENDPEYGRLCVTGGRLNLYKAVIEASKNGQILRKVDDVNDGNSVLPGYAITYTIRYANPPVGDPNYIGILTGVNIVDYLPDEVEPNNPLDPNYNPVSRTYRWNIGTLLPGDANSIKLTVKVNNLAEPLGTITNLCMLRANEIRPVSATEITDVNAWNPPVIYVDVNATGANNGMSWKNAYRDLQDALERASHGWGEKNVDLAGEFC
jgi:subtilisin family serine protease